MLRRPEQCGLRGSFRYIGHRFCQREATTAAHTDVVAPCWLLTSPPKKVPSLLETFAILNFLTSPAALSEINQLAR
jgi:hypothetical protein